MRQKHNLSRRDLLRKVTLSTAVLMLPDVLAACKAETSARGKPSGDPDSQRLTTWIQTLMSEKLAETRVPLGRAAARVGELAAGTPYEPYTLEQYLGNGGSPRQEPLTLSLTRFDCVTLVEACLAVARLASAKDAPNWQGLGRETERMRYRDGKRRGYSSRLHYFSEWISDGERRGLVKDIGADLNAAEDARPLRFMTEHRDRYPALKDEGVFQEIAAIERRLDDHPRRVVPTKRIPEVVDRIEHGDVLAFATEIPGLDVTHSAFAYRDGQGTLRVLHAPLSGGLVEVTHSTLPEYVAAIRRATGILVARPR